MSRPRPPAPTIDEMLASEVPTRPLGGEAAPLAVLLASPSSYAVGMGGLSLPSVWESLANTGLAAVERVFCGRPGGEALLPDRHFGQYDVVGFSLPYELEWLNVPAMLATGGLPVRCADRDQHAPIVLAGGASITMNPVPLSGMVDAFLIGELEPVAQALAETLASESARESRLAALARLPGIYVPSLNPEPPIARVRYEGVADAPRTSPVISPHSAFPNRFLIEAGRGCPMGCGFCLAGQIYRPVRFASRESLLSAADEGLRVTRSLGLIGAALSGYPDLAEVVTLLVDRGAEVSMSSLRADRLTPGMLEALVRGGQRTVTIAPEAATDALRASVNKSIPTEAFTEAISHAEVAGVGEVRLYFMGCLPGESEADALAIADLVAGWAEGFPKLRFGVTISPFVPKPWTRLGDEPFPAVRHVRRRLDLVAEALRKRTPVTVRAGSARWSAVQAALARGDSRVGLAMERAEEEGGGYSALKRSLRDVGIALDAAQAPPDERPWTKALGTG